jgi:hypothetical protein
VNFLINSTASQFGDLDSSGRPMSPIHLNAVTIRLGTKLNNLSVEEVLNIVMKIADRKIKYSVEDYGVLISYAGNEPTPLHTRFFHMNSSDFQRVLQSVPRELTNAPAKTPDDVPFGRRVDSEHTNGIRFLTEVTPAQVVVPQMQNWLKSLGVELTEPGKALFYNDKLSMMMIRATLEDLDVIEKALQPFGIQPKAWTSPRSASELTNSPPASRTAATCLNKIGSKQRNWFKMENSSTRQAD